MKPERERCKYCQGVLVAIGSARSNGKGHSDWKTRQYHKKCWLIVQSKKDHGVDAQ